MDSNPHGAGGQCGIDVEKLYVWREPDNAGDSKGAVRVSSTPSNRSGYLGDDNERAE